MRVKVIVVVVDVRVTPLKVAPHDVPPGRPLSVKVTV
jgi:hypothetical protein